MYIELSARVGYVPGGTNIGVVRVDERQVILIDSGLNDTPVRRALRAISDQLGSTVIGIVTTHGHADHFGGNAFAVKRAGARVYAPPLDAAVLRHPILLPSLLFGGAEPLASMRGKFLLADPSPVDEELIGDSVTIDGVQLELVDISGHSLNQRGIVIDGVFFCADVVFPASALEKYRIPYLYSLTDHLKALDTAQAVDCTAVVPGHGSGEESIGQLIAMNRAAIERVSDCLFEIVVEPIGIDALCAEMLKRLEVSAEESTSYYLVRATVAAYLSHYTRAGTIVHGIENGHSLWQRS